MANTTKINDLQILMKAISIARKNLIQVVNAKFKELEADHPKWRFSEVQDRTFGSTEVTEAYQNLNNLYGVLGSDIDNYREALEDVETEEKPILKKAG